MNPKVVRVTVYGALSAVDIIAAADIIVAIDYQLGSTVFTPKITLSPGFADRVVVKSVEPEKVRVR